MDIDYTKVATAIFFLGGVVWLIRWIGRTLVEVSGSGPRRQRESSDERLQQLFVQSGAASYLAAQRGDPQSDAALPNAGRMTRVAVLLHCPACGEPVSDVPIPLPFAVECPGCRRRLNTRGDGPQRMSIVVTEPRKTISS